MPIESGGRSRREFLIQSSKRFAKLKIVFREDGNADLCSWFDVFVQATRCPFLRATRFTMMNPCLGSSFTARTLGIDYGDNVAVFGCVRFRIRVFRSSRTLEILRFKLRVGGFGFKKDAKTKLGRWVGIAASTFGTLFFSFLLNNEVFSF